MKNEQVFSTEFFNELIPSFETQKQVLYFEEVPSHFLLAMEKLLFHD